MEVIKVAILGIVLVLLVVELRAQKPALAIVLSMAGAIMIVMISMDKVIIMFAQLRETFEFLGEGAKYLGILLKVLGVTYVCQFSSGVCKDAGLCNLSEQIQIFGKLYILLTGMPILLALITTLKQL